MKFGGWDEKFGRGAGLPGLPEAIRAGVGWPPVELPGVAWLVAPHWLRLLVGVDPREFDPPAHPLARLAKGLIDELAMLEKGLGDEPSFWYDPGVGVDPGALFIKAGPFPPKGCRSQLVEDVPGDWPAMLNWLDPLEMEFAGLPSHPLVELSGLVGFEPGEPLIIAGPFPPKGRRSQLVEDVPGDWEPPKKL